MNAERGPEKNETATSTDPRKGTTSINVTVAFGEMCERVVITDEGDTASDDASTVSGLLRPREYERRENSEFLGSTVEKFRFSAVVYSQKRRGVWLGSGRR